MQFLFLAAVAQLKNDLEESGAALLKQTEEATSIGMKFQELTQKYQEQESLAESLKVWCRKFYQLISDGKESLLQFGKAPLNPESLTYSFF